MRQLIPTRIATLALAAILSFAASAASQIPPTTGCGTQVPPPITPLVRLQTPPVLLSGAGEPLPPPWSCAGEIGAAITGGVIDPSALGIGMNLLTDGFHLTSLTLRSDSDCGTGGLAVNPVPVLETAWNADAGGSLFLSQRPASTGAGDVLDDGSAWFWWNGYAYELQLQLFFPPIAAAAARSAAPRSSDSPVLLQAIAELAPGLDLSCFSRWTTGGWESLAAAGIGDPRPAIPNGYAQTNFALRYLAPPAPGCPNGPPPAEETTVFFSVTFASASGGTISISAWGLPAGSAAYPGTFSDYSLDWSSPGLQFSISADNAGAPLGSATLFAIARLLDPTFSPACLLQAVTIVPGDLPGLGFNSPVLPDGYSLTSSDLSGDVVSAACPSHFDFRGTYSLFWSYANPQGLAITANAIRMVSDNPGPRTVPVVTDSCISWSDDRGTSFLVTGYSVTGGPGPSRDVLIAVARSMDPGAF